MNFASQNGVALPTPALLGGVHVTQYQGATANAGANGNADAHAKAVAASRERYPILHKSFMTLYDNATTIEGKKTIYNNAANWNPSITLPLP